MGKGLDALGKLTSTQNITMYEQNECLKIIEKELKALKIIIEKKVNIDLLLTYMEKGEDDEWTLNKYNTWWDYPLTIDEYKSIKEIINDYK